MALPKDIKWVTFDVYGTLIDWESGAYDAFQAEAKRDGFTIERDQVVDMFVAIQQEIQAGTSAPTSISSSPPSRCAHTSPTRRISRRPRAGSAARRVGCTWPRATTTT